MRLNKWSFLRDHVGEGKLYQKIALRHINFDRNNKITDNLETFLNESIGHEYGLSVSKLKRKKTSIIKDEHAHQMVECGRSFFYSELVAKAFKCLGIILDDDTSCS